MAGNKILEIMRQTAKAPLSHATDLVYGEVTSVYPLTIRVDNRFEITSSFIIKTSLVSDFDVNMQVNGQTQTYTVKLGLKVGEKVILLRTQNGQRFIIIDRIR